MAQVLHGSARTTQAIRGELQRSTESLQVLAARYHLNPKTVAKWRGRPSVAAARRGPWPASTVLSPEQEAACEPCREPPRLPLDDCLYAWREALPQRSRSALHRCFQRPGVSRLPPPEGPADGPATGKKVKASPIGYLHVDFAELRTAAGTPYLVVAVDRPRKVAVAGLPPAAAQAIAAGFLHQVLHQVLAPLP